MWQCFRHNTYNNPPNQRIDYIHGQDIIKTHVGGIIWGTAVIDNDNNVYVGSTNKRFYCIDKEGNHKWVYIIDLKADSLIDSAAAIHPLGFVVIPGGDGCLHAVDIYNGQLIWKYEAGDVSSTMHSSGVVVNSFEGNVQIDEDGMIYAGCDNEYMYCLYPNGSLRWKFKTKMMIWNCAVIVDNYCIFGSLDYFLYVLDKRDGTLIFKYNTGAEIKASPLFHDNLYYVANTNGIVFCFKEDELIWKKDIGSNIYSSPVVHDDGIIFATYDGVATKLHLKTGQTIWETRLHNNICCSPTIVNDILFIGNSIGKVIAVNCHNASIIGVLNLVENNLRKCSINASITLDNQGNIVVGSYDGCIYRFPWTIWEHNQDVSFANITGIAKTTPHLRVVSGPESHIISIELIVPYHVNACVSYGSVKILHDKVPFKTYISADGKFINLVPTSWNYLGKTFTITITGSYYLQSNSWLKDRLAKSVYRFQDTVEFQTYIPDLMNDKIPSTMNLANFYIQQPIVLDTYIPAAMDGQGFQAKIEYICRDNFILHLIPCIPDIEYDFVPKSESPIIRMMCKKFGNVYRAEGAFEISAMGGTIASKRMVAYLTISENNVQGQFFGESSCLAIKGNGSSYKFSTDIINKLCDVFMNLNIVGRFSGKIL